MKYKVSLNGRLLVSSTINQEEMKAHYNKIKDENPTYQLNFDEHCLLFTSQKMITELLSKA